MHNSFLVRAAIALGCCAMASSGLAQSGASGIGSKESPKPMFGSTFGTRTPAISSSQWNDIMRHRDSGGRPCLTVSGYSQPRTINQQLYDHMIVTSNKCPKAIKLKVCYYQTERCLQIEAKSYGRQEAILGTAPAMKDFRFEFRETF